MAQRHWVGGTASWNGTAGSKWALTNGGAGGQAEPTSSDDVFFDSGSGAVTVTVDTSNRPCNNLDCTGFTGTLASSGGNVVQVNGTTWTLGSGMTNSCAFYFLATSGTVLLHSNGKTVANGSQFGTNGAGTAATFQLQDNFTVDPSNNQINCYQGTLDLNGFTFDASSIITNNGSSGTFTLSIGSGTLILSGSSADFDFSVGANITINSYTGVIKFTNTGSSTSEFSGGNRTYSKVWFSRGSSTGINYIGSGSTFGILKDDGSAGHAIEFQRGTTTTISSASGWQISGTAGNLIILRADSASANTYTISCASGNVSADYLNIAHCIASGGASFYAGTHSTNNQATSPAGSGWIFTAPPINNGNAFFMM